MTNHLKLNNTVQFLQDNFWVGGSTVLKALIQLLLLKVIAKYLGIEALGVFGQTASCVVVLSSIFTSGLLNFSISEFSKEKNDLQRRERIWKATFFWLLLFQAVFFVIGILFSESLSNLVFLTPNFRWYFYVLPFGILFFGLNSVSTGFLSALADIKKIFFSHLVALIFSVGAIFSILKINPEITPVVGMFVVLVIQGLSLFVFSFLTGKVPISSFIPRMDAFFIKKILQFSIVLMITGALGMLYQMYMRTELLKISGEDWGAVGAWQAILKVSEIGMSFLGLSIIVGYYPKLSSLQSVEEIRQLIFQFSRKYFFLLVVTILTLMFTSKLILSLIYDHSYESLSSMLSLQLLGDLFKLSGWIFTYFFLAKVSLPIFLFFESTFLVILTVTSLIFMKSNGVLGLIYAHTLSSLLFFMSSLILTVYFLGKGKRWIKI